LFDDRPGLDRAGEHEGKMADSSAATAAHGHPANNLHGHPAENIHGHPADPSKRDFLTLVAGAGAAIGAAAIAWPLIDALNPSKDVLALSSVEVDLTPIPAGSGIVVSWQGKPIFVRHRTPVEIKSAEDVKLADLRQGRPRPVDHPDRHLHPSRLHPAGQQAVGPAR
jgi:hypothetical protein